jgi:thiol-disulfide isomerase/thioredoxin
MDRNLSLVAAIVVIGAVAYAVYVYKTKHAAEGSEVVVTTVVPETPAAGAPTTEPAVPAAHAGPNMVNNKAELDALSGGNKPVVLKVFATWCPPCQAMKPEFEKVAAELGDKFIFAEADADKFADKEALKVEGLPTVIVFKNGAEAARFIGGRDAAGIKQELAKLA